MIEYTVEVDDNNTIWRLNGKLHREGDLPAKEYTDGTQKWFVNGECHRENGPAMEWPDGKKGWYLKGVNYTEEEYNEKMNPKQESCEGKIIEVDGKKYKLVEMD